MAKAEGIDVSLLREKICPTVIDTAALQYEDLARIIASTPERINELSKAVIADVKRFDLISLLERAAHANGFVYAAGGWIPVAHGAIEEVKEARLDGEVQAIRTKIRDGIWSQEEIWIKAPDGRILIDVQGYEKWVVTGGVLKLHRKAVSKSPSRIRAPGAANASRSSPQPLI